jgi:hypothetical protein
MSKLVIQGAQTVSGKRSVKYVLSCIAALAVGTLISFITGKSNLLEYAKMIAAAIGLGSGVMAFYYGLLAVWKEKETSLIVRGVFIGCGAVILFLVLEVMK